MTRFPVVSSIVAVVPLALLGWPLAQAIKAPPAQVEKIVTVENSDIVRADLSLRSAHPFTKATVTIEGASWTFTPEIAEQEIRFPRSDKTLILIQATWPEDTPESAILLEVIPDGLEMKSKTVWGLADLTEEVIFTWETN